MIDLFGPPTIEFCEKIASGLIGRPYYALSGLPYFVVAAIVFVRFGKSKVLRDFSLVIFTSALLSLIYDIHPIYLTQLFDLSAMMLLIGFLLYQDIARLLNLEKKKLIVCTMVATLLGIAGIIIFKGFAGNVIFGAFVLTDVVIQDFLFRKGKNKHYVYWVLAFLIFAAGFAIWLLDPTKIFCSQIALFNGRAIFHYFVTATFYLLALFYAKNENI